MSQENVEIVRSMFEAWNRGDIEGVLAAMDPAIKIDYTAGAFPGLDDSYDGHDRARQYWRDLREPWISLKAEIERMSENEGKVAVVFTFEGKGRDGIVVHRRLGSVSTLTNGLVSRFDAYADPDAALEAAGLRESVVRPCTQHAPNSGDAT